MAVHRASGTRDPISYPRLENDDNFVAIRSTKKLPYNSDVKADQSSEPWQRLYNTCTLSSSRHEVYHLDPQAPGDSLDFLLKAKYDHHSDLLRPLASTRVQSETTGEDHGRVLKNKLKIEKVPPPPLNHPIRILEVPKKEKLEQAKLAIESHHTILTNRGYTRKPDGGFFTT